MNQVNDSISDLLSVACEQLESVGLCIIDEAGKFVSVNQAASRILELSSDLLLDLSLSILFPSRAEDDVLASHQAFLAGHPTHPCETLDGYFSVRISRSQLKEGQACAVLILEEFQTHDTSWPQKAIQSLGEAIVIADKDCKVRYINRLAESLLTISREASVDRDLDKVLVLLDDETEVPSPIPTEEVIANGVQFKSGTAHKILTHSGKKIAISERIVPLFEADGQIGGLVIAFRKRYGPEAKASLMKGQINSFEDAVTVLQTLVSIQRDGALTISTDYSEYSFYLDKCRLVHLEHSAFSDDEAFHQLTKLEGGEFQFNPFVKAQAPSRNDDVTSLLLDIARQADESQHES